MNRVLEFYENDKFIKELYSYIKKTSDSPSYEIECALAMNIYASANRMNFVEMYNTIIEHNGRPNKVLKILYDQHRFGFKTEQEESMIVGSFMRDVQMAYLPNEWKKYKQTYEFDAIFANELANTETTFTLRENEFDFLPFSSFYMDFSDNKEICEEIGVDGILVKILPIYVGDEKDFLISSINYRNGEAVFCFNQVAELGRNDLTIEKFLNSFSDLEKHLSKYNVKDARKLLTLQIQSILYLSTYQPEYLYETKSSVAKRASSKKNKTHELQETTYRVGEYYGIKYLEYIKKSLEEEKKGTSTGRHVRPHPVRGHFQHYLMNDPVNGGKMSVPRWVEPYFTGMNEKEADKKLDNAKHKVIRTDLKNKEKLMKNKNIEKKEVIIYR